MSKSIEIRELKIGMILASPVKNKYGQVILPVDTVLEEKHKKTLKMWGIKEIIIKADKENGPRDILDEKRLSDAKDILSKRFTWIPQNKHEEELYTIALQITLEKIY